MTSTRTVTFQWDTRFGECYDCGLPAAYTTTSGPDQRLCCVCAAQAAADGEIITRLDPEF